MTTYHKKETTYNGNTYEVWTWDIDEYEVFYKDKYGITHSPSCPSAPSLDDFNYVKQHIMELEGEWV